jgi:S-adenosylmethionine uptake transporter
MTRAPASTSHSAPILPFIAVAAGIASFGAMDAVMKALSLDMGVLNALFWRSLVATFLAAALFAFGARRWPDPATLRLHIKRALVTTAMAFLFFWGLARTPMGEAIAISFIAPLIALYLAVVLLGETVGKRSIFASLMGLAGVVVIVAGKAGTGSFDRAAQLGIAAILGSAVLYAWNLILQRQQAQIASPQEIALFQNLIVTLVYALSLPFLGAIPGGEFAANWQWGLVVLGAGLGVVSMLMLSWGYARAEAQALVPIEYSMFIWAVLLGWLFFDESIGLATIAGTVLIVAGCWVVMQRKPRLAKASAAGPVA